MSNKLSSNVILECEYLPMRAKILELAASLDRMQRAAGDVGQDPRLTQLRTGIEKLLAEQSDRAEQIQLLFSRSYDQEWKDTLKLAR